MAPNPTYRPVMSHTSQDHPPVSWPGATAGYITALRAASRSEGTVRLHRHYLSILAREHHDPWRVTTADLRTILACPGWGAETRKSARTVFRGFYRWAYRAGLIAADPAVDLDPIRVPAGVARPTPEAVVAAALLAASDRVQLMIGLAAFAGLRCAEIARVHERDVSGDLLTVHGKGGKVREVPLVPRLLDRLRQVRGWGFPNGYGSHITPGHVSRLLSRALPDGWTGHTLRHRCATRAYGGTRDLLAVSALLGHSRPETTQRYVRLPDDAVRRCIAAVNEVA